MNTIQFLTENSLEELERKGIKSHYITLIDVYIFNYEQIPPRDAFPKDHPIIIECRNLVLRKNPWRLISQAFVRFFNWNEDVEETKRMTQMMTMGKVTASVKLDGSLITVVFDDELHKWHIFTRGSYADTNPFRGLSNLLSFEMTGNEEEKKKISRCTSDDLYDTFGSRVRRYLNFDRLDKNFSYVFELCTPGAHITKYDKETLTLLMSRDKRTGKEVSIDPFDFAPKPDRFTPTSINDVFVLIKGKPIDFEGYVLSYVVEENCVVDGHQRSVGDVIRMKVKSDTYVAMHHLGVKTYNLDDLILIVLKGEMAEIVAAIPEYKDYLNHVSNTLDEHIEEFLKIYEEHKALPRKNYAPIVKNHPYSWFLFELHGDNTLVNRVKQRFSEDKAMTRVITSFKKTYYADKKPSGNN